VSKNKRPNGATDLYHAHMNGGSGFQNNPAANRQVIMERMYFRILTELAANRFKWSGMPPEIDVRYMELCLYYTGLSVFFRDEDYDKYFALKGGSTNYLNMMDNPTAFVVIGNNYVSKTVSAKRAVPIWANYLRMPDLDIVTIYSQKFAELDRTIEINSKNARRAKVVAVAENGRLTASNITRQIDEGQSAIAVAAAMQDLPFLSALDLGIDPKTVTELSVLKARLWNECMGYLGIENANQDKKERLVASEVDANNDQTSSMRRVNLNAREMAATQINAMFGLNVSVEYWTDAEREEAVSNAISATESGNDSDNDEVEK